MFPPYNYVPSFVHYIQDKWVILDFQYLFWWHWVLWRNEHIRSVKKRDKTLTFAPHTLGHSTQKIVATANTTDEKIWVHKFKKCLFWWNVSVIPEMLLNLVNIQYSALPIQHISLNFNNISSIIQNVWRSIQKVCLIEGYWHENLIAPV